VFVSADSCEFSVWAPNSHSVEVCLLDNLRSVPLQPSPRGYHSALVSNVRAGDRYRFRLDGRVERADPASRYQPEGVFGPSQVVNLSEFQWDDRGWHGLPLQDYILYELHVGTYTPKGTFAAIIDYLEDLKALGVSAIELMPVAQFPGTRNWGYDGVFPFAVQNSYGGPLGLQQFVNACHQQGLAVVLDVVYNHLGPEGNYLSDFGPYFTDRYRTPWGQAINFDGPHSDEVVHFFVENALSWLEDFHIDALRLDAIHGIFDRSAEPFLARLSTATDALAQRTGRHVYLIAESDLNDSRFVTSRSSGGYGLHAQWSDDFHHALHSLQTGERGGYFRDFGSLSDLEQAMHRGYVYTGQYSEYRQRRHGNSPDALQRSQFVVYSQNHDQVGNRMLGERSSTLLSLEALKLSAAAVILSPFLPLLFMGEEYGETVPFLYFTNHDDPALGEAVQKGRTAEFSAFHHTENMPDPQAESTFQQSRLDHQLRCSDTHLVLWNFHRELIRLRKHLPALRELDASTLEVTGRESDNLLVVNRVYRNDEVVLIFNFGDRPAEDVAVLSPGQWQTCMDSAETKWHGPGTSIPPELYCPSDHRLVVAPRSFCLLRRVPVGLSAPNSALSERKSRIGILP
jgi:maltooligosyltrehalose trehalohydrolase